MAHRNLGQTLLALEDLFGAVAHLERAAALDPGDAVATSSLAQAYRLTGAVERATRAAEEARGKTPVYGVPDPVRFALEEKNVTPLACDRRARAREQRGEWSAALADLERLVEMDTVEMDADDGALRWRLGRCLRALGQGERARAELARALELDPDHLGALAEGAALAEESGDLARAAELYGRAAAQAPENPLFWKRLGACLGPLGDLPGALEAFERAGAAAEPDAELLHNWGTALARAGRLGEACVRLQAALALEPSNAGTHFSLAASLALLGRREEAILHYERAQELDAKLPVAQPLAALRAGR
jgi:tetratricopeptide (TPR) repeat protein